MKEANRLGCVVAINGARNHPHKLGAGTFETFSVVHSVGFTMRVIAQFTNVTNEGIPDRFPNLRLAFLEIGCTWLPYWLDRMDDHWKERGAVDIRILNGPLASARRARPDLFQHRSGRNPASGNH
jgi:hypothetical protein